MTCAKQFWKKMYTGWVMSIERQGNQGSTIPDTMCVVPYIAFYVSVCYFTKTRSNLLWFWWLQNVAVHTNTYMLHDQLFLILSHLFFHNTIALPVLKFIFNLTFFHNWYCLISSNDIPYSESYETTVQNLLVNVCILSIIEPRNFEKLSNFISLNLSLIPSETFYLTIIP